MELSSDPLFPTPQGRVGGEEIGRVERRSFRIEVAGGRAAYAVLEVKHNVAEGRKFGHELKEGAIGTG